MYFLFSRTFLSTSSTNGVSFHQEQLWSPRVRIPCRVPNIFSLETKKVKVQDHLPSMGVYLRRNRLLCKLPSRSHRGRGYPFSNPQHGCRSPRHRPPAFNFRASPTSFLYNPLARTIMAATVFGAMPPRGRARLLRTRIRLVRPNSTAQKGWDWTNHQPTGDVARDEVAQLAASPRRPLTLADLLR